MSAVLLPYPGQDPSDELTNAVSLLRLMCAACNAANSKIITIEPIDLIVGLADAIDKIEPVLDFLNKLDVEGMAAQFAECRRQWVMQKGGAK
jgi:hypothetical protein